MNISNKIRSLNGTDFKSNVLKLMSGSLITQAVLVISSPIITRIYSSEEFGILSIYTAVTTVVSVFITGKYELAIVQSQDENESKNLFVLSILLSSILSMIIFLSSIVWVMSTGEYVYVESSLVFFSIALSIFSLALISILNYSLIRLSLFGILSVSAIIQTVATLSMQLFLGYFDITSLSGEERLIVGQLAGQVFSVVYLLVKKVKFSDEKLIFSTNLKTLYLISKKFIDYPRYILFANLYNKLSVYLPVIVFAIFFSPSTAGFFALAQRTIRIPMTVIGKSVGDVYFKKASDLYSENENRLIEQTKKMIKTMFFLGSVPTLLLIITGEKVFSMVFGENWSEAGVYAGILSIALLFQFCFSPLARIFHIYNKQRLYQNWELIRFLIIFLFLLLSLKWKSGIYTICLYTVSLSLSYIILGLLTARIFRGSGKV